MPLLKSINIDSKHAPRGFVIQARFFRHLPALVVSVLSLLSVSAASAGPLSSHLSKLPGLKGKVEAAETEVKHLIAAKQHTSDPKQLKQIVDSLAESHRALVKAAKSYEEERLHVRFKHADENADVQRKYVRFKVKSLEEMSGEVGIHGRLDRVKVRVLATFPAPEEAAVAPGELKINPFFRKPASENDEEAPEKITLKK